MAVLFTTLNPAIVYGGSYVDSSDLGRPSRHFLYPMQIDVVVTGTAADFGFFDDKNFTYTIDGGAPSTYTTGGSFAWTTLTLFTGLSDTAHVVSINFQGVDFWVDEANFLLVTGSSPALATPSGMDPHTYMIHDHESYFARDGSMGWSGGGSFAGYFSDEDTASATMPLCINGGGSIRFRATCAALQVWNYGSGRVIRLAVDGVDSGSIWTDSGALQTWIPIATGLDGGAEHEYRISGGGPSATNNLSGVMTVGGSANLTNAVTDRGIYAFYGDSITAGVGLSPADSGATFAGLICLAKGVSSRNLGASGAQVFGPAVSGEASTDAVTGFLPLPSRVLILYGVNDQVPILAMTETLDQFQAAYTAMVQAIVDGLSPATKIHCLGTLDSLVFTAPQRTALNARIPLALVDVTGGSGVLYLDTSGWIDPTTDIASGVHPNEAGHAKIAAAYLAATAVAPSQPAAMLLSL